jgi:hypothetical protein
MLLIGVEEEQALYLIENGINFSFRSIEANRDYLSKQMKTLKVETIKLQILEYISQELFQVFKLLWNISGWP